MGAVRSRGGYTGDATRRRMTRRRGSGGGCGCACDGEDTGGDGREREGARREGRLVEEDEAVGAEYEEVAAGVLLWLEIGEREQVPLDLDGGEHRTAGRRDGRRCEGLAGLAARRG
jgi:hypothetical protein